MKVKKLTAPEFARAVKLGLGRALLHIKEYGDEAMESTILDALMTNSVYEMEVEGTRSQFLMQLVLSTGLLKSYASALIARFEGKQSHEGFDFMQQVYICSAFFQLGFDEFLPIVFAKFKELAASGTGNILCATELTCLAGFAGLEFSARVLGAWKKNWSDYDCGFILEDAREQFGEDLVDVRMAVLSLKDDQVRSFMEACTRDRERCGSYFDRKPLSLSLKEIIEGADGPKSYRNYFSYRRFGKTATDDQILQVFNSLVKTPDKRKQLAFLQVFFQRDLPLFDLKLFDLVSHQDSDMRAAAVQAFHRFKNVQVRRRALKLLKSGRDELVFIALKLLTFNYRPTDAAAILAIFKSMKNVDEIHSAGFHLQKIAHQTSGSELSECFIWLYENGPDSYCRTAFLEQLIAWKKCPPSILFESQWDSRSETQCLAREICQARKIKLLATKLEMANLEIRV